MSVALQVMLFVVAIVVAVAGIGVALALRTSARQRKRQVRHKVPVFKAVKPRPGSATASSHGGVRVDAGYKTAPVGPVDAEQAHQAKLAALQSILAHGDAKAKAGGKAGDSNFPDTEPVDEGYASTQFVDRPDPPTMQISLLNLDKVPAKRSASRSRG